jgi:ABC-2 type transport system ATP-binding protein
MMKNRGREEPAIEIRGLRVVRGGQEVIADLGLNIPRGQLVGLLGPSGCGKSTLIRAVVGVQRVAAGGISVFGLPAGSPGLRRRIGYQTQAPSVYLDLTVQENLHYFAAVLGHRGDRGRDETARVLEAVNLTGHETRRVGSLSGGQLSRVSLAVALLGGPELLVLDEPTVGLDPVLRRDLWKIFRDLAQTGTTLLVSSHVMDEAVRCDRLLLMREGAMLADGPLEEILAATQAPDAENAFLTLVDQADGRVERSEEDR